MDLYITNTTKQNLDFHYRLSVHKGQSAPHVRIASGTQIEMKNVAESDAREIVRQLEKYGARDAAEAHGALGTFAGILYRFGNPVDVEEIHMGHDAVVDTQEKRSVAETQKSALGFDHVVQAIGRKGQRVAKETSVEIVERGDPREKPTGKEIDFKVSVNPEGGSALKLRA
jgi:hypothetical protein